MVSVVSNSQDNGNGVDDPRRHRNHPSPHRHGGAGRSANHLQPRLSEVNRIPVASMRMRMDDYVPPKPRRNDQGFFNN